jgi:hypothetical protein
MAPEITTLLNALPIAQDLLSNIAEARKCVATFNLPGVIQRLGAIGSELQALNQACSLGIVISTPGLLQQAKDLQRNLIRTWDTGQEVTDLNVPLAGFHAACVVLASCPSFSASAQVFQNLRQVERALDKLDAYRKTFPSLKSFPSNPQATLLDPQAHRWLQVQQELQRQLLANVAALESAALEAMANADATISNAGGDLIDFLSLGATTFVETITCFTKILNGQVEATLKDFIATPALNAVIGVQLAGLLQQKQSAVGVLSGTGNRLAMINARNTAKAKATDTNASVEAKATARKAASDICATFLPGASAARIAVYDLSIRYQSCIASAVAWTAYVAGNIFTGVAVPVLDEVNALRTGIDSIKQPIVALLNEVSTDGVTLSNAIDAIPALKVLLAGVATPLKALPPAATTDSIAKLLQDVQDDMAAATNVLTEASNRAREIGKDIESLTKAQNLIADLMTILPIPQKVSLSYDWHPDIKSFEPVFLLDEGADFVVKASFQAAVFGDHAPVVDINATLTNFSINLIGSPSFIIVRVKSLSFTSQNGNKPDCRLVINKVDFGEDLAFVQELAQALNPKNGPFLEFRGNSIRAGFRFHIPDMTVGAFNMMQLAIEVCVALSFDGSPVRCQFGLSDQTHPFMLSAGIYGGGGFLQLQLGLDGVEMLEGALEFGVVAAISIGPVEGFGYVVAGIYFRIAGNDSKVCGFVHAHGHMDIFGLISLDIDLYVAICYTSGGHVHGIATFSVSVHILFFSADFHMQAEYDFVGSGGQSNPDDAMLESGGIPLVAPQKTDTEYAEAFMSREEWASHLDAFAA